MVLFQEINVGSCALMESYVDKYVSWCKKHWLALHNHQQQQQQLINNQQDPAKKWVKFKAKMKEVQELKETIHRSHKGKTFCVFF